MHTNTEFVLPGGRVINAQSTTCPLWAINVVENPRQYFDPKEQEELDDSVEHKGIFTPVVVRVDEEGKLALVVGGRRYRAASNRLGKDYEMPIMFKVLSQSEARAIALAENKERANVTTVEEAIHASKVLGDLQGDRDETAKILGWSRTLLDARLSLLALSETVMTAVNERKIVIGIAELLAKLPKANQDKILPIVLSQKMDVKTLKTEIQKQAKLLKDAIFDKTECGTCSHNSDQQGTMFSEELQSGSCAYATCYTKKTEEELEKRLDALKDTYPVVRIIRPGDNKTVIRLVAEGDKGVGAEQAQACLGCANYGAGVSALPEAMGTTFKSQCFDVACNTAKVKTYQDSLKPKSTPKQASASSTNGTGKASETKVEPKAESKPVVSVAESPRVKEYREKIWRTAFFADIQTKKEKSLHLLFGLASVGKLNEASYTKFSKALSVMSKSETTMATSISSFASLSEKLESADHEKLMTGIVQLASKSVEVKYLESMMTFLDLKLASYWKINEDFLKLLTKSEMDFLAKTIKLDDFMGAKYSALIKKPNAEIIKGMLESGFDFTGVVPDIMQFKKA